MIAAEAERDADGRIRRLRVEGHAGPAHGWEALVCAAASTLAQTAVLGLEEVVGLRPAVTVRDGYLECVLPPHLAPEARARAGDILETIWLGLSALAETHPRLVRVHAKGGERTCDG